MIDLEFDDDEYSDRKSKSQLKREMLALQELGEKLANLPLERVLKMEILPELKDALVELKKMSSKEAKRRHMQYIGALMRDADPEPIKEAVADAEAGSYKSAKLFKKAESWRDRLCEGDDSLESEIIGSYPGMDITQFRQYVRNARKEREKQSGNKASRTLFRFVRDLIDAGSVGSNDSGDLSGEE